MRSLFFTSGLGLFLGIAWTFSCQSGSTNAPTARTGTEEHVEEGGFQAAVFYVHARKGLNLRTHADPASESSALLSYGDSLQLRSDLPEGAPFSPETYGPVRLAGQWNRVKTSSGLEGYVFEHYISRVPTSWTAEGDLSYLEWFYRHVSPGAKISSVKDTLPEGALEGRITRFSDGGYYEMAFYEGGITERLSIPGPPIPMAEAFVVLRSALFPGEHTTSGYDSDFETLTVADEAATLHVKQDGDLLVIMLFAG